jgi:predicted nucleic acid-binding protein
MSHYELLSLLTSIVAAIIALCALVRGNRLARKQLDLQRKQSDLASLQHKLLVRDQISEAQADLRVSLNNRGGGSYTFRLWNAGMTSARNVRIAGAKGEPIPEGLIRSQVEDTFPIAELRATESVSIVAAIVLSTAFPLKYILTWDDDSGTNHQREFPLHVS